MKTLFIFIVFQVVLLNQIYTQSDDTTFIIHFNGERKSSDTFKNKKIPANIDVYKKHDSIFLSIKIDSTLEKNAISITLTETDYYPDRINCKLNDLITGENELTVKKSSFKKYTINGNIGNDGKYVFRIIFKYRKKFQLYDLFLFPSVRHFVSNKEEIELVEI